MKHGMNTNLEQNGTRKAKAVHDPVNRPRHYTQHPSGVECIAVAEHMNFCRGNAVKYIWRAGEKGCAIEDLKKARWYLDREIKRLEAAAEKTNRDLAMAS